jgi:uncharacterized repeat protein (TIGR02543 family)
MKKKLFLLAVLCLLAVSGLFARPAEAAAPTNQIYVAKNESAGLMGDVHLYSKGSGKYALYLPGAADAGKLCFSWASTVTVTNGQGVALKSGQVNVAAPGQSVKLTVNGTSITVETVQGSKDSKAMFLEVDTSISGFYSFSAMNSSSDKSKSAAGTMAFSDTDGYYFSIKGRGNATWTSAKDKKPYNITLYKDGNYDNTKGFELIPGVKAKKWSLLANYYDSSLLRNKLAYDLALKFGMGLESVYVDLWVDGEYRGNYLMTPKNDYDAPKEGYMLELDNYTDPDSFKVTGMSGRITIKENDALVPMTDIARHTKKAWAAIYDETSEEYLNYLDLDSWAKFYLLHEFYMSFDVMYGSQFMYRMGTSDSDKLMAGPVWDMDNSMGKTQTWSGFNLSYDQQHSPLYDYIQSIDSSDFWLQELGQHESFITRVHEIYNENKQIFDNAAAMVETYEKELEDSALMNYHRWGYQSGRPKISSTGDACGCVKTTKWQHYVENLRNYAEKRAAYLESAMPETLVGQLVVTGEGHADGILTATVTDTNAQQLFYTWQLGDRSLMGGNQVRLKESDIGKVLTCTVTAKDMAGKLVYTMNPVNVTLNSGSDTPETVVRYHGLSYGQLPVPEREGYDFLGWFTGPMGTGKQVTPQTVMTLTAAHTLYAQWEEIPVAPPVTEPSVPTDPVTPTVPTVPTTPTEPVAPTVPTTPTEPAVPTVPAVPTDPVPTEPPATDPASTDPVQTTAPPATDEPVIPTMSQIPGVGTEPSAPAEKPEKDPPPMKLWYILVPVAVLVLLILLLLRKRKKEDEN